jgi:hypothetical protein
VSRLPVELADFAVALNGAIGRLDAAYRQLEEFDAATSPTSCARRWRT